jgi:hypothetical protein
LSTVYINQMFKQISSGFGKFFTRDKVLILVALLILGYALFSYGGSKSMIRDNLETGTEQATGADPSQQSVQVAKPSAPVDERKQLAGGYSQQAVATPGDLLPVDQNNQWSALNPVGMNQGNVQMPDLLQAGYHIGLDTIGQTLRNANQQLRSDPVIPKVDVGPWWQSTIEPDLGRTPLELGGAR